MAPQVPRLRAYLAPLMNASSSEESCDACDAVTPDNTSTYPVTSVSTLVTLQSASKYPHRDGGEDEHQISAEGDLEECEAMALEGGVSPAFAREFAVLQVSHPAGMDLSRWSQAIDDVGVFLDKWGDAAEQFGWTAGDVIGPQLAPTALAWALQGAQVISLTRTSAHLSDGRTFLRAAVAGEASSHIA